jgi:hypothetical protein
MGVDAAVIGFTLKWINPNRTAVMIAAYEKDTPEIKKVSGKRCARLVAEGLAR